jgi:hypothetical protein
MCVVSHSCLQTQIGSSPVSPLRVVPDFVTSVHLYPLGNVMIFLLGQESLDSESLVRRHGEKSGEHIHHDGGQKQKSQNHDYF